MNITQLANDVLRKILLGELRGMRYLKLVCKRFNYIISDGNHILYPKAKLHKSVVCDQLVSSSDILNMAKCSIHLFDNVLNCQFINALNNLHKHSSILGIDSRQSMMHQNEVSDVKMELLSPLLLFEYHIFDEYSHIDTSTYLPNISLYTLLIASILSNNFIIYAQSIVYLNLYFRAYKNHIKRKYKKIINKITNPSQSKNIQVAYSACMKICNNYMLKDVHFMYAMVQLARLNDTFSARVLLGCLSSFNMEYVHYIDKLIEYSMYYFNLDLANHMLKFHPNYIITVDIRYFMYAGSIPISTFTTIKKNNRLYSKYCDYARYFKIENDDRNSDYNCIDVLKLIFDVEANRDTIAKRQGGIMNYNYILSDYVKMVKNVISHNTSRLTDIMALIASYDITADNYLSKMLRNIVKDHLYQDADYGMQFQNYFG